MVKKDFREPLEHMAVNMKGIDEGKLPLIFANFEFLIPVSYAFSFEVCLYLHLVQFISNCDT